MKAKVLLMSITVILTEACDMFRIRLALLLSKIAANLLNFWDIIWLKAQYFINSKVILELNLKLLLTLLTKLQLYYYEINCEITVWITDSWLLTITVKMFMTCAKSFDRMLASPAACMLTDSWYVMICNCMRSFHTMQHLLLSLNTNVHQKSLHLKV